MQIAVHGHVPQQPPAPNRADFAALGTQTPGPWRPVQQLHAPALHRYAAPEGWHSFYKNEVPKPAVQGKKGEFMKVQLCSKHGYSHFDPFINAHQPTSTCFSLSLLHLRKKLQREAILPDCTKATGSLSAQTRYHLDHQAV